MSLHLHRAADTGVLADALGRMLADPLADPFATELVAVPAHGIERWLSQRISHRLGPSAGGDDGVCAGVIFRSSSSVLADLLRGDVDDPWAPDTLAWTVLAVIDASLGEEWCRYLNVHLGHGADPQEAELRQGRRYAVARRLAGLFASYARQRPALLADWEAGRDTDGAGRPLPADLTWQAELWRRVRARVAAPSPAERLDRVAAALRAEPDAVDLPERVSWFGPTRLAAADLRLLTALAEHREVHVWLSHPSAMLWDALRDVAPALDRRSDQSHLAAVHPLLGSLGRDLRELEQLLLPRAATDELLDVPSSPPDTLLTWLRDDISANRLPAPTGRVVAADDDSVQVHACHGPVRQVEVLREVILGLLDDDPTLEPRDIVVMCPDIEAYAPLITAAFGAGSEESRSHPGQRLDVRLADRALTRINPVLGVLARLLDLAEGRAEVSAVLDLIGSAPVRRRFGFTDSDLETIATWIDSAGIRWAFDAEHRRDYGLTQYVQNTWRFGMDRLLAGVAVSDDAHRWFDTTLPLDDVGSTSIDLAGRFAECVDRLVAISDRLSGSRPLEHWSATLNDAIDHLTAVEWGEEWQIAQAHHELARAMGSATDGDAELRLADVRALLGSRLAGRPSRANFRTGTLTVCTLVPMRSVPHRVVCVLGLDDGVFPRSGAVDGDDVLARGPVLGERDPRSEDRQLLLDAVMSARDHLVVTYSGFDQTNGADRPPAVPLGELLDTLDLTAAGGRERAWRPARLQAFDPAEFDATHPFSFDAAALAGAQASLRDRAAPPTLTQVLLPPVHADVDLAELLRFVRDPVGQFLRQRLEVTLPDDGEEVADAIPIDLDGLQRWGVGHRMLTDLLAGLSGEEALGREWRRGALPPGRMGWSLVQRLADEVRPIADEVIGYRAGHDQQAVDVDLDLGEGRRLIGTVADVYGDRIVAAGFSRIGPKQILDAWVPLLALTAAVPDVAWTSGLIGRGRDAPGRVIVPAVPEAMDLLRDLVALYDQGLREPLPLPLKTGYAWATNRSSSRKARWKAETEWSRPKFGREDETPAHVAVWGFHAPFDVLVGRPRPEEAYERETTRLGALASRLWVPILDRLP